MRPIHTLEEVIHDVTNALSLISSHSQYLLSRVEDKEALQIIYEEAERAASLLGLVPQGLARSPLHEPALGEPPQAQQAPQRAAEKAGDLPD